MEFLQFGEASVKIVLDESDMKKYGVCYESLDYGSTHTKRIIWDILDAAKAKIGFDVKGGKLHIQVYPSAKGGCEMYISRIPQRGTLCGETRKVFAFPDLDAAIEAVTMLCGSGSTVQSVMYECEGKWYISAPDAAELSEYGNELSGALWEPYLAEHGKAVAKGKDLIRLAEAFGRQ